MTGDASLEGSDVSTPDASADAPVDTAPPRCANDSDCAASPVGKHCEQASGQCVECLATSDDCALGHYCVATTHKCEVGCRDNNDCRALAGIGDAGLDAGDAAEAGADGSAPLFCVQQSHRCVGCLADGDCPLGSLCDATGTCVAGCTAQHGCAGTRSCCLQGATGSCVDLQRDPANCSACGLACDATNSVGATCVAAVCTYSSCKPGFDDCDKAAPNANGCESSLSTAAHCGACNIACDTSHSIGAACPAGVCTYTGCAPGYDDCNRTAPNANGCETQVNTRQTCGSCTNNCANGSDCCNLACAPLNTTQNCGSCGNACGATQACNGTQCVTPGTCQSPFAITGNQAYAGTTVGRSNSSTPACTTTSTAPDATYSFTATRNTTVTASLCGSSYDTVMYVGTTCGSSNIACNDNSCGLQSSVTFAVTAGTTYYVVVDGFAAASGTYTLTISGL